MMALKLPLLRQLAAVAIPLQPDRPSASATASAWRGQRIGAHSPADAAPPRLRGEFGNGLPGTHSVVPYQPVYVIQGRS